MTSPLRITYWELLPTTTIVKLVFKSEFESVWVSSDSMADRTV